MDILKIYFAGKFIANKVVHYEERLVLQTFTLFDF